VYDNRKRHSNGAYEKLSSKVSEDVAWVKCKGIWLEIFFGTK